VKITRLIQTDVQSFYLVINMDTSY